MLNRDQKTVTIERTFDCSVEKLFSLWSPEQIPNWWKSLRKVEMAMQPGGAVRFEWHSYDGFVSGNITEVEENKILAFSWKSSRTGNESLVTIKFLPNGSGSKLSLVHSLNATSVDANSHHEGWTSCLIDLGDEANSTKVAEDLYIERTLNAPIDLVFDAWTNPEVVASWWNGGKGKVSVDLRENGQYRLDYVDEDGNISPHYGEYKKVDKPTDLVFSWISDYSDGETEVALKLEDKGQATKLALHHKFFRSKTLRDMHHNGWNDCLDVITQVLST